MKTLKVQIIHTNDLIKSTPIGDISFKKAEEVLSRMASVNNVPDDHLILLDTRQAHMNLSTTDIWYLAAELGEHRKAFQRRFAVLVPSAGFDNAQFFELCAKNRGFQVHATTDFEEAINWLTTSEDLE